MKLYSKNGVYPDKLPFRIVLPDGSTRTDPSSFSAQEIADAGYVEVETPPNVSSWQNLLWENNQWVLVDKNIDLLKQHKLQQVNNYRDNLIYSEKSVTLTTGKTIPVDVRKDKPDLQNISGLVQKATLKLIRNETDTISFRGADDITYVLTPEEVLELGEGVLGSIEEVYKQSWIKKAEIEACVSSQEVSEVVIEWVISQ